MARAREYFQKAREEHFAIGAFNAASIETLNAVVGAAKKLNSPVMIEASHGEVEYFGLKELVAVVRAMEQDFGVPILLNLDHAPDYESCKVALDAGFDYLHLDGSKLPYEQNVEQTRKIVVEAHQRGVLVEGEIDNINAMGAGSSDHRNQNIDQFRSEEIYTNPEKAAEFVMATGVDTFASFVGNVHGLYSQPKTLKLDLLERIADVLPGKFLSLHGGSGIPDDDVKAAIKLGIVKVNVNSELREAFFEKLKLAVNNQEGGEIAIYKLMPNAITAMQQVVEKKIEMFGSGGKI
mgnify:CR=1 FL=1